jgi:uncharacterized protein (TIGR03790 family)
MPGRGWALLVVVLATGSAGATDGVPTNIRRSAGITASELAVIVNAEDPNSMAIGEYYAERRRIPKQNILRVHFAPGAVVMSGEQFRRVRQELQGQMPTGIEAQVLTWIKPWRVDCMAITTAFAAGYDPAYCAGGCQLTRRSPYFNAESDRPFEDFGLRPTMLLGARSLAMARDLIERGIHADNSDPAGTAYLVETSDRFRSVRAQAFADIRERLASVFRIEHVHADAIENRDDVMFYFTGLLQVPALRSNRFQPGAIADHLTSTAGVLEGGSQMSSLEWLDAGATASYGTVVEPCNFPEKFPNPGLVISRYLRGETIIEAYWKSVMMPGQGLFIGEPLAAPFAFRRMLR